MADPHIERLLDRLTVEFQASVAREEIEAAADLALSLAQSAAFADQIARHACDVVVEGRRLVVEVVADDYLRAAGGYLVLLDRATISRPTTMERINATSAPKPERRDGSLVELLRSTTHEGAVSIAVASEGVEAVGRLDLVGPDYVALQANSRQVLIPLASVRWIRLVDALGRTGPA